MDCSSCPIAKGKRGGSPFIAGTTTANADPEEAVQWFKPENRRLIPFWYTLTGVVTEERKPGVTLEYAIALVVERRTTMQLKAFKFAGAAILCAGTLIPQLNAFERKQGNDTAPVSSAIPVQSGELSAFPVQSEVTCRASCVNSSHSDSHLWLGPKRGGTSAKTDAEKDAKDHNDANAGHEAKSECSTQD